MTLFKRLAILFGWVLLFSAWSCVTTDLPDYMQQGFTTMSFMCIALIVGLVYCSWLLYKLTKINFKG